MIQVENLSFTYGKTGGFSLKDISFAVAPGEIFGFLGPSGAGKSTLQKILVGLLRGWTGRALVAGCDMHSPGRDFAQRIGVDFEFPSLYGKLSALENLEFFASLYKKRARSPRELLALVGLESEADKKVAAYSKGMKSRLNFVKALAHGPELLFLDEPTSGLDPANARIMKNIIRGECDRGAAVILTTHNMHDAAELCDRVAFIVDGEIRALDNPRALVMSKGAARIDYSWFEDSEGGTRREEHAHSALAESGKDSRLQDLVARGALASIHSSEPTLEDIFVEVTGRALT